MRLSDLPRGAGAAVFPGNGAWLPRTQPSSDAALLFRDPTRILVATRPEEVAALLDDIETEQARGAYVAGYLAYEAGTAFGLTVRNDPAQPLPRDALPCDATPLAWMAVYPPDSMQVIPGQEWQAFLDDFDESRVAARLSTIKLDLSVSEDQYTRAIGRVRDYIAAGDTYQVNYTVRARYDLRGETCGTAGGPPPTEHTGPLDPLEYFLALLVRQSVPYSAYLDLGDTQVLSLSPELFLRRDGDLLESRPMKGTRPRGRTHPADVALAYELAETEKERAENLMILDMVRNDLGRVSRTGTIHVPALFSVEPYRTVWQMTSTVQGRLQPGTSLSQLMRAVFPGASITGAPKHHTMEIISEVETEPRGVYTGTVALFSAGGDFTGNIGIRTIVHSKGRCVLGIGSGVVWDALAVAEYEETLAKGAFALPPAGEAWRSDRRRKAEASRSPAGDTYHLFETMLLEADGRYRHLELHVARMETSARALGFRFDRRAAEAALEALAVSQSRPLVVRMDLDREGIIELSTREAPAACAAPVSLMVSPFRVDPDDPLLRRKTSRRGFYDREHRRAVAEGCFDALFINRLDRVTEGGISNIFARFGETWVTPPAADGLLPGIWRAKFMAQRSAAEKSFTLDELLSADEIVVGNSVRGALQVESISADPLTY